MLLKERKTKNKAAVLETRHFNNIDAAVIIINSYAPLMIATEFMLLKRLFTRTSGTLFSLFIYAIKTFQVLVY